MTTGAEALEMLHAGNQRFVSGTPQAMKIDPQHRRELTTGQKPFAIVLACSDSRVPVEIVFDQGLGDLFVVRVAGNIASPSQLGSIEFAAEQFGTPLVVVLGHSQCGAVAATLQALQHPAGNASPNLLSIVDCIRPALEPLLQQKTWPPDELLQKAVRAHIRASVRLLQQDSPLLEQLVQQGNLQIVGAEYSLESGRVEFFEELPNTP